MKRSALYGLFFLALALAYLWPAPAHLTSRVPSDPGDPLLNAWILWWNTQAVPFTDRWWNAPIFHPVAGTLAYSEHLFGIAVFTAPLQLLGLNAIGAYNVAMILASWLSGFFAFLLARRLTGSTLAGLVGGVAFAIAPYRAGQLAHLQVLNAQWMPLCLFAMHAYLDDRRRRWLALFAVAWLLQAWSNGYFLLFFPVVIGLWLAWFVNWRTDWRGGLAIAGTFAASSLLLVPSLLKYREIHSIMGFARQRGEMVLFSAEPSSLLRMPDLLMFWPYYAPKTGEDYISPGVTTALLVVVAMIVGLRRVASGFSRKDPLIFYTVATIIIWLLSFGPAPEGESLQALWKPYTWLTILPGFDGLRAPSRFAMLACVTFAAAAAVAFHRLTPASPRGRGALLALVGAGLIVDGWPASIPLHGAPGRVVIPDRPDTVVLEVPIDETTVATAAMYRQIDHGQPLVTGYSGHFPGHYRILTSAFRREDPTAIQQLAVARPLLIFVNHRYDPGGWLYRFIGGLPGIIDRGGSSAGAFFELPPQPRPRVGALGAAIPIVARHEEERDHTVLDLGSPQIVRAVGFPVRWHFDQMGPRMQVEASDDGKTWTSVWLDWTGGISIAAAIEDSKLVPVKIPLPDVRARYLRIHPAPKWLHAEVAVFAPQ